MSKEFDKWSEERKKLDPHLDWELLRIVFVAGQKAGKPSQLELPGVV